MPSKDIWWRALFERYEEVRNTFSREEDRQWLFNLSPTDVKPYLEELSARLYGVCVKDDNCFRVTMVELIEQIRTAVPVVEGRIRESLTALAAFVGNKRVLYVLP